MTRRRDRQDTERRTYAVSELRIDGGGDDGEEARIVGHAAVFNQLSEDLGGFRERVAPGAFSGAIAGDVRALFNHNPDHLLGRTKSRTLRLREEQSGLAIEIDPPDTTVARDLLTSIGRGDVTEMSFGFRTIKDQWENTDDGAVRTLIEVELFDVSPVTFAAYPQTDVALRSLDTWRGEHDGEDDGEPDVEAMVAAVRRVDPTISEDALTRALNVSMGRDPGGESPDPRPNLLEARTRMASVP